MSKRVVTETVVVTVTYKIRYHEEGARADALKRLDELPLELSGVGPNGCYGVEQGRVVSKIPLQEFSRE